MRLHAGLNPPDDRAGRLSVRRPKQDTELVSAEPGGEIVLPDTAGNGPGRRAKYPVACDVAVKVVHLLEMVQVQNGKAERLPRPGGQGDPFGQLGIPRPAVGEARERIGPRRGGQCPLRLGRRTVASPQMHHLAQQAAGRLQLARVEIAGQMHVGLPLDAHANDSDLAAGRRRRRGIARDDYVGLPLGRDRLAAEPDAESRAAEDFGPACRFRHGS